mmetsp:Transcript_46836/g.102306  ORF Transcript_46836/g.102306 Transcript_46836/m.102306 type:complete len:99 (-) Transcript_46836:170-466(-)
MAEFAKVEICTVDSYQGKENDIVIISLVRSKPVESFLEGVTNSNFIGNGNKNGFKPQIGFIEDRRRFNVALTRCRKARILFGNYATLRFGQQHDHIKN